MRLHEIKSELKPYPVIVPPSDLNKCIELVADQFKDDGPFVYIKNGKEYETDDSREWVESLPKEQLRHEAVHALQDQQIPQIYDGLPALDLDGVDWDDFDNNPAKKKKYMSRHPEIMAFAFDAAHGIDTEKNMKEYERIGGEVEKLFHHYVNEYKKT